MTIAQGWDSYAWLDGPWIHREPRRPEIAPRLIAEATLLPWLAPQLPVPVPVPERTEKGVRHLLLPGEPLESGTRELGREIGRFLKALHTVDPAEAVSQGALDASIAEKAKARFLTECREHVVPLLPLDRQADGEALLGRMVGSRTALIHSDVGPEHLLVADGRLSAVIDWTDAEIGDPAVDLSWLLNDAPRGIAEGVADVYPVTERLRQRAYHWHQLSPWYEAHRGVVLGLREDLESGRAGILARL